MIEINGIYYKNQNDIDVRHKVGSIMRDVRKKYVIYGERTEFYERTAGPNELQVKNGETFEIPEGEVIKNVIVFVAREPDGWGFTFRFGYDTIKDGKEEDILKRFLYLLETNGYHEIGSLESDHTIK